MCEMLGSEPIESEMPVEISDFPEEVRQAFNIYSLLRDIWEGMSGSYMGKDYGNMFEYYRMYMIDTEDYLFYTSLLQDIDAIRAAIILENKKSTK